MSGLESPPVLANTSTRLVSESVSEILLADPPSKGRRASARLAAKSQSLQTIVQKRRSIDDDDDPSDSPNDIIEVDDDYIPNPRVKKSMPNKRIKFNKICYASRIPTELLQIIFQECEPKALGKLMRVCKRFDDLLRSDENVCPLRGLVGLM